MTKRKDKRADEAELFLGRYVSERKTIDLIGEEIERLKQRSSRLACPDKDTLNEAFDSIERSQMLLCEHIRRMESSLRDVELVIEGVKNYRHRQILSELYISGRPLIALPKRLWLSYSVLVVLKNSALLEAYEGIEKINGQRKGSEKQD